MSEDVSQQPGIQLARTHHNVYVYKNMFPYADTFPGTRCRRKTALLHFLACARLWCSVHVELRHVPSCESMCD